MRMFLIDYKVNFKTCYLNFYDQPKQTLKKKNVF